MLRILDITNPDINNGTGIRATIWVSGCKHHCPMCHNPWTWKFDQGYEYSKNVEKIREQLSAILDKPYYRGVTFSGGDPFSQDDDGLKELIEIMVFIKEKYPKMDIWLYTGYTLEELKELDNHLINEMLEKYIDTLVDGRYEHDKQDLSLGFRGSSNQRIIKLH